MMKKIKIVADSSCDMFSMAHTEFACAPMKIITAEREFVDDERLDVDAMADFLYNYKGKSKSSCPNTTDWLEAFGDADEIYCVTITSGLSGSYNSACSAKVIYESEHKGAKVKVFDTSVIPSSYILSDAFKYSHLVFASTTYNAGIFISMEELLHDIANHQLRNRKVAFIENGTWAPVAARNMLKLLEGCKNLTYTNTTVKILSALNDESIGQIEALAEELSRA